MAANGEDEDRPADLRQWLKGEMERRHPEAAQVRAEYAGWLVGSLRSTPHPARQRASASRPPRESRGKRCGNREFITSSARSPRSTAPGAGAG
jgi:Ser/Thr protein kinase RdoA (MazF antagonist)